MCRERKGEDVAQYASDKVLAKRKLIHFKKANDEL